MPAFVMGVKSTNPKKTEAVYPAIIAIRIGMVEKKPLNSTDPNTATPSVIKNTVISAVVTLSVIILAPILPPRTVSPTSSNPMSATTEPIAAGGRIISIHDDPNL